LDPLGRHTGGDPQFRRGVVGLVHGHPHPVAVHPEHLGHELPRERDGPLLEVVAEAEVPQHLEERVVARRLTDVVNIDGPEALLHRGGPRPRRLVLPDEVGDERDHAGDREHDRWIPRDQAGRGHSFVGAVGKEPEERRTKLVGVHHTALTSAHLPIRRRLGPRPGSIRGVYGRAQTPPGRRCRRVSTSASAPCGEGS
jgi:hypothetical protein